MTFVTAIILAFTIPWSLTLYFSNPKFHREINVKFGIFTATTFLVYGILSWYF